MEILGRVKGALMVERVPANAKGILRNFVKYGPLKAAVEGSGEVWNTNTQRIDNLVGTKLSQGGPL